MSVTLIMGTLSFACGFLLLGFNAAAIDHVKHSEHCSTHADCKLLKIFLLIFLSIDLFNLRVKFV